MSIQEKIKEDNLTQEAKDRIEMDQLNGKLEKLTKALSLRENVPFQEWLMDHVTRPLQESIKTILSETETNKSFRAVGMVKTYQKILGWTHDMSKEIMELKTLIAAKEAAFVNEEIPNSFKPEN